MTKVLSQLDHAGYFVGPAAADESPLEPGVWLFPAGCIDQPPPAIPDGQRARWDAPAARFILEDIPVVSPPSATPSPSPSATPEATIHAAVQRRLDDDARTLGYDNILAACSYATSTNPTWRQEATALIAHRDATWAALFLALDADPPPTCYADIEARLPNLLPPP